MKAVDESLGALLSRERRHLVPTYQRDYEWTEVGQWQLLMDDIFGVAERLRRERLRAAEDGEEQERADERVGPHFLGALVLEGLPQSGAQIATSLVIDGQQRLTTISLLLRGLADVLGRHPELRARAKQVRKTILILDDDLEDEERYKLWPRRRDRDAWRLVMAEDPPQNDHVYTRARLYFADRIEAEFEDQPDAEMLAGLGCLVERCCRS